MKYFKITDKKSAAEFDKHMMRDDKNNTCGVVKYYAPWCGHCKTMEPIWKAASKPWVNTDDRSFQGDPDDDFIHAEASDEGIPHMNSHNAIEGFPTILYLENGKKKEAYSGQPDAEVLGAWIKKMKDNSKQSNSNSKQQGGGRSAARRSTARRSAARRSAARRSAARGRKTKSKRKTKRKTKSKRKRSGIKRRRTKTVRKTRTRRISRR